MLKYRAVSPMRQAEWISGIFLSDLLQSILLMAWTTFKFFVEVIKSHCTQHRIYNMSINLEKRHTNMCIFYYKHIWRKKLKNLISLYSLNLRIYFPPRRTLIMCVEKPCRSLPIMIFLITLDLFSVCT